MLYNVFKIKQFCNKNTNTFINSPGIFINILNNHYCKIIIQMEI